MAGLRDEMKIFLIIITSLVITGLLFSGCSAIDRGKGFAAEKFSSEDDMDAAVEAVDKFFALLVEKDYEEAYGYLSRKDKENNSQHDFISEFRNVTEIVKVEIIITVEAFIR